MKTYNTLILTFLTVLFISCKTEDLSLKKLDLIPADKYYSSDIVPESYKDIYGVWKVTGTSGGFTGMGYTKDFDYLILKRNGIFGIIRNDSLIAYGKLTLLPTDPKIYINALYCSFDFDKSATIELNADKEKYIQLAGKDTLNLIAPCCDRYNTQLVRQNSDWYNSNNPGTLKLKISIGPICPVETIPPQPGCMPTAETYKNWQTAIWNSNRTKKITDVVPNLDGTFQINLSEGQYILDFTNSNNSNWHGGSGLPIKFTIKHLELTPININIDTGIR